MREILFRGKDVKENWHIGLLAHVGNAWYISNKAGVPTAFEVIPSTIGQYTTLKDKNGKMIFEGDIVKIKLGDITKRGIVAYSERAARVGIIENGNIMNFSFMQQPLIKQCSITVIGNYHDNPEPLEEKK